MEILELVKIIFLGIVEGVTEWLPISSTGHLLLVDQLFALQASDSFKNAFVIVIQLGAILAVPILFFKKLFPFSLEKNSNEKNVLIADKKILLLWVKVIVGCIPAGVIGILLDDFLEEHLHTPIVIALALIIYGILFIVVEKLKKNAPKIVQSTDEITYKDAIIIGLFQALALIPGTSRSGATIIGALIIGVARPVAAEFTFFLAIPVMLGASAVKIIKFFLSNGGFTGTELGYLFVGTLVAFAVSLFVIRFLMNFVRKHDFSFFGYYRIALGCLIILALILS